MAANGKGKTRWMYPTIPANLAIGPLSTLIPLYILQLGGGILDVSYAITIASMVVIPSLFFWGYVTDLLNKRRLLIVLPYMASTVLLASLFLVKSIPGVILLYALIAFINVASTAPLNMLVMDNSAKEKWSHNFSKLQMMISLGTTIGLVVASIVTGFTSLANLIIVLSASSLFSAILALKLIKEPKVATKAISVSKDMHSFINRIVVTPMLLMRVPHWRDLKNMFNLNTLKRIEKDFIVEFYVISFIFYLGTSVFNTEYPVGLKLSGLSESSIFFVILFGMIVQTIVFYDYDYFAKRTAKRLISYSSLLLRGGSYFMIGALFLIFSGSVFSIGNLIFYCLASGVAYSIYYTVTYTIFFDSLSGENKGTTMGIYSGLAGVGTFLGALISGGIAVAYGFAPVFMFAGALMFLCAVLFRNLRIPKKPHEVSGKP